MKNAKKEKLDSWFERICREIKSSYLLPNTCKGGTVIDCGSNVGGFPATFKNRFDRYICYEADSDNYEYSKKKIKQLNLSEICTFENKACYKNGGEIVSLYKHKDENPGDHAIYTREDTHPTDNKIAEVKTISLEDIIEKYFCHKRLTPIKLLKCDIEGAEYDFLLDKDLSIFEFIILELHQVVSGDDEPKYKLIDLISKTHHTAIQDTILIAGLKTRMDRLDIAK